MKKSILALLTMLSTIQSASFAMEMANVVHQNSSAKKNQAQALAHLLKQEYTLNSLYNLIVPLCIGTINAHKYTVAALVFTNNGFITGSKIDKAISVCDEKTQKYQRILLPKELTINALALNSPYVAIVNSNGIWVFDHTTNENQIFKGSGFVRAALLFKNGNVITGSDNDGKLWDKNTGKCIRTFTGHNHEITVLALSDDETLLITGSNDTTVKVWDIATGKCIQTLIGHTETIYDMVQKGNHVLTGSADETAILWDIKTGKCIHKFTCKSPIYAVSLNKNYIVTGSTKVKIWNRETGEYIQTLPGFSGIGSLRFSPDGNTLITGSQDGAVMLWDFSKFNEIESILRKQTVEQLYFLLLLSSAIDKKIPFEEEPKIQEILTTFDPKIQNILKQWIQTLLQEHGPQKPCSLPQSAKLLA